MGGASAIPDRGSMITGISLGLYSHNQTGQEFRQTLSCWPCSLAVLIEGLGRGWTSCKPAVRILDLICRTGVLVYLAMDELRSSVV